MEQYCKLCNNLLNVSRVPAIKANENKNLQNVPKTEAEYIAMLKKLENDEMLSPTEINAIDLKEMVKTEYYKQMQGKGKIRKLMTDMLDNAQTSDEDTQAYFVCENCFFSKPLTNETHLFAKSSDGVVIYNDQSTDDIMRNKVYQSTLPRTRNFICPNKTCKSNTHPNDFPTEACFFRKHNTYAIIMICTICHAVKI